MIEKPYYIFFYFLEMKCISLLLPITRLKNKTKYIGSNLHFFIFFIFFFKSGVHSSNYQSESAKIHITRLGGVLKKSTRILERT